MTLDLQVLPRVTKSEGAIHVGLIADLVERYGANTIGFRRSLVAKIREMDASYAPGGSDELEIHHRKPDAYLVSDTGVIAWEVESTHELGADRLREWADLWWELDASDLHDRLPLDLRIVDKYGVERSVNLCAAWFDMLGKRGQVKPLGGYTLKWAAITPGFSSLESNLLDAPWSMAAVAQNEPLREMNP